MNNLEQDYRDGVLRGGPGPCLSLYQPTHRHFPANRQDPLRFRNLVERLEQSLRQQRSRADVRALLAPFQGLAGDEGFWNHALDGLAVLAKKDLFRVYRLQRPVPELAVVADSFHTKPLLRTLQSADRFQVLALTIKAIRLYEGNRDVLDEVELADEVPTTLTDALGKELTEPHQTVASYGGVGRRNSPMFHGHGGREDEMAKDTERWFRVVDRAVLEHHSGPSGLPLLLAALPQHQALFRSLSRNPHLVAGAIEADPDALTAEEMRDRAWQAMEPVYLQRLGELTDRFAAARGTGLAEADLRQIASAAVEGRIETLLVDADQVVAGRVDPDDGRVLPEALDHPETDDLLDDLGELTLKARGEVVVVPGDRMPSNTGAAALFRY